MMSELDSIVDLLSIGWHPYYYAKTCDGKIVDPLHPGAISWSIVGAAYKVSAINTLRIYDRDQVRFILSMIDEEIRGDDNHKSWSLSALEWYITEWEKKSSQSEVLRLLTKTI